MKSAILVGAIASGMIATQASAYDPAWPELQSQIYGDALLTQTDSVIEIDAPYRTPLDPRTGIGATIVAPEGQMIQSIAVILDNNPMPVSAVFDFTDPVPSFFFDVTMRINGPTPLHVVATTDQGQLFVAESFVKTSGQGACAAPPGTDPELALATLGEMNITVDSAAKGAELLEAVIMSPATHSVASAKHAAVDISHPSHSGMQMDQITLLYIPSRYIETVGFEVNGKSYFEMTGSISLSEDPQITVSLPENAQTFAVELTDTSGTVTTKQHVLTGF